MRDSGFGGVARMAAGAIAANEIADGDYQTALERLADLADRPFLQAGFPQLGDLVEAAVRSGNLATARQTADQLSCYAQASGTPWVVGISQRCEALLAEDDRAEAHYRASLASLDAASHRGDRARTQLVYGEWLRRMRRRNDARAELQAAWDGFEETGAVAFAQRARRELKATGAEPVESASVLGTLTAQEIEVARLAARGATNAEIGAALFISTNTVDYHLRKVFRKLDVTSRRQLSEHVAAAL
jgi:DNA-binding CsgD family transcriptional regulator